MDTVSSHRGKGYALKAVAAWAIAVRAEGRIPFYSTSWDNQSSQRVAEKLGLIPFAVEFTLT